MTRAEFFQCLRDSRDKFVWTIGERGMLRAFKRDQNRICLDLYCPITAVHYVKTDTTYHTNHWQYAAKAIRLIMSEDEQLDIVGAADGSGGSTRSELEEAIFGKVITQ